MDRNKETIETYNKSAVNYQNKFMDMDLYNDTYEKFCELITKQGASLLEIACGPGNVTRYFLTQRPDLNIKGIDLAPNMVELAKLNNPQAEFEVLDCRELDSLKDSYDAIVCGFCMPYLSKEECAKMIADSYDLLRPSGVIYFSTMEGDYANSGYETTSFSGDSRVYIYYHQEAFLKDCLIDCGYEIIEIQRKKYPEPDGSFLTDMIFIARKV